MTENGKKGGKLQHENALSFQRIKYIKPTDQTNKIFNHGNLFNHFWEPINLFWRTEISK